jgi:hypothetical protein
MVYFLTVTNSIKENMMTIQQFLCLTNADLNLESPVIRGIVYCPGLVCTHCQMPVSYGVILSISGMMELRGSTCAAEYKPSCWIDGMRHWRHFQNKAEIRLLEQCEPHQQDYWRALTIHRQIFPENQQGLFLYNQFFQNGSLDKGQILEMRSLLLEIGWLNALVDRRDTLNRLKLLASLGRLLGDERSKIFGLLELIQTHALSSKQVGLVVAIQKVHGEYLVPLTQKLLKNWPPVDGSLSLSF